MYSVKSSRVVAAILLFCGILFVGCSKQGTPSSLVSLVPDDAVVVKAVDFEELLSQGGCSRMFDNKGNLLGNAEKVVSLVVQPDYRDALTTIMRVADGVDMSRMVVFTTAQGYEMVVMFVDGVNLVESAIDDASGGNVNIPTDIHMRL